MIHPRSFAAAWLIVIVVPLALGKPQERRDMTISKPSTEPKGVSLELSIGNESPEPIEIHTGGDPSHVYQEKIEKAEKAGKPLPGSIVELYMEIKNTGREPITIWVAGDSTLLTLELQGNGARTAESKATPADKKVVAPSAVTIQPGKSFRTSLYRLAHGVRNEQKHAYVTEGGSYLLSATFKTAIAPAPKDSNHFFPKGFGEVILKSGKYKFLAVRPS